MPPVPCIPRSQTRSPQRSTCSLFCRAPSCSRGSRASGPLRRLPLWPTCSSALASLPFLVRPHVHDPARCLCPLVCPFPRLPHMRAMHGLPTAQNIKNLGHSVQADPTCQASFNSSMPVCPASQQAHVGWQPWLPLTLTRLCFSSCSFPRFTCAFLSHPFVHAAQQHVAVPPVGQGGAVGGHGQLPHLFWQRRLCL